ncbi:STAS domain-containing protein [Actinoplanes teichomyceticus]|uniref:Anti-sigma factor antagonist n=1 Tax=Actinoplanes teichomyceticus TaxID=1867 RepID=A0A561VIW9_ACTTI|nr:STAS domain-containing protein [Actinoplanes teichomyceticus]TWG11549.1 SpoIIAA-like anti-anti-sigma regulatory factor [Actinoplanes teichomyceticus]GIF15995.1 hypothetical protein Ate01nite_60270 [Actinoplanes teichomyceticus]
MTGLPLWQSRIAEQGDTSTVTLAGELDLAAADELREMLTARIDRPDVRIVVVDIAAVDFLDSAALGALLLAYRHAADNDCEFVVTGAARGVRRLMEIAGVHGILAGTEPVPGD